MNARRLSNSSSRTVWATALDLADRLRRARDLPQQLGQLRRVVLELVRLLGEAARGALLRLVLLGEPPHQDRALLEQAQRRPERVLDGLALLDDERVGAVLVADAAAEGDDDAVPQLVDRPAALGTRQARLLARLLGSLPPDPLALVWVVHRGSIVLFADRRRELGERRCDLLGRQDSVGRDVA